EGRQIASSDRHGAIHVRSTGTGELLWTLRGHSTIIRTILYSPQGDLVVSASDDNSVRLWDAVSGRCRAVIEDFHDHINDVDWVETPTVDYIVAGCDDGVVGLW
ncbi:MAG: WD40-repeat-containing domain protein, partial [Benniella sp.]